MTFVGRGLSARIANRRLKVHLQQTQGLRGCANVKSFVHDLSFGDEVNASDEEPKTHTSETVDIFEEKVDILAEVDVIINNITMEEEEDEEEVEEEYYKEYKKACYSSSSESDAVSEEDGNISVPWDQHRCSDCIEDDETLEDRPCAECDCTPCLWDKYGVQLRKHMSLEYSIFKHLRRYRCLVQRENKICSNAHRYWLTYLVPGNESYHGNYIPKCAKDGIVAHYPDASGIS